MEHIIGGSNSIVLPSDYHSRYTNDFSKNRVCKVTYSLNYELIITRKLNTLDKKTTSKYFSYMNIESLKKLSYNRDFKTFVCSLNEYRQMNVPSVDFYYFTMEYAGEDLFELCARKSAYLFNEEKKLKIIIQQLFEGIRFLHNNQIGHFDIKPENIAYCHETQRFKYIDFGYAENYPFISYVNSGPRGTPDYIPLTGTAHYIDTLRKDPKVQYIPCNDWTPRDESKYNSNYVFYNKLFPELAYKADTFALGKTLYYVYHTFLEINNNISDRVRYSTEAIIYDLINNDIIVRPFVWTIDLKRYFKIKNVEKTITPAFGSKEYLHQKRSSVDYATRLNNLKLSESSSENGSVNSIVNGSINGSVNGSESVTSDSDSDSVSITSEQAQNTSVGCLSNNKLKLGFRKLISFFL